MKKILIIILLFIPTTINADDWTNADAALQATYSLFHIADWNQTLQIINDNERKEANIILGSNPSEDQVNLYFTSTLLGHYYVAKKLNRPYRALWQMLWIGRQLKAINHNKKAGLHINFKF
jgi:hypothetical protein